MRFLTSLLLMLLLLSSAAVAQLDDDEYVSRYFGTKLIFITDERPYDEEVEGWWGNILPEQLLYNSSYLCGIVNSGRVASGNTVLLDPDASLVDTGYEEESEDGGFRFPLSFKGMRPSEVKLVIAALGGLDEIMPNSSVEFEPLASAMFNYSAYGDQDSLDVSVGELSIVVTRDMLASELFERIKAMYLESYGRPVELDLYYSQGLSRDNDYVDLSLTVTLVEDRTDLPGGPDF